ncbi:protein-glutamate O-methyltransferase CheR [Legionella lytica]|uniref:Protein-glutamate O-methyltransferase CheR n=1 Tax=Legionella lytica TaxID=96232 RepID=A0ABY4YBD7_9GAMM|nr:protein-glutamate O-methyltransferase CheR [Legionella lytica]USQ14934.1 protein-glutamate O-methyltransferase CheR [Legionella lytica]
MTNLLDSIKILEPAFIKLIHERFGLVTHINQARELTNIIAETCTKFNFQPNEYLDKLKHCSSSSALLADLVAAITVGESYFFRDKTQMQLLEKELLPRLIQQKKETRALKIWSAGCSSGEEIYTIAMLLLKLIPDIERWDLQLLGTDINLAALEKAMAGIYGQWSMRSIPDVYLQNYFTKEKRTYVLSPKVRDMVRLKYLNLSDNSYPSIINGTYQVDLILCRNVLIYFENDLVVKIMKKLSQCLAESAYLLLGASDPIIIADTNLVFHHDGAIYFTLNSDNK